MLQFSALHYFPSLHKYHKGGLGGIIESSLKINFIKILAPFVLKSVCANGAYKRRPLQIERSFRKFEFAYFLFGLFHFNWAKRFILKFIADRLFKILYIYLGPLERWKYFRPVVFPNLFQLLEILHK